MRVCSFCGLHDAHVRITCPVCDITHVRKCARPSPTASDGKLGEGLGTREVSSICGISWDTQEEPMSPGIPKCPGMLGTTQDVPTRGEYVCLGYYIVIHGYLGHYNANRTVYMSVLYVSIYHNR